MAETPGPPEPDQAAPTPLWVYAVGVVVIIGAVVLVVTHLSGGGIPQH